MHPLWGREFGLAVDFSFIRKYVERNPYTGSASVDLEALSADPTLRAILRDVWDAGYSGGFDDGVGDCTVEQAHRNPYSA